LGVAGLDDLLEHLLQFFQPDIAAVFELHLEAAGNPQPIDGRGRKGKHNGLLDLGKLALQVG